MTHDILQTDIDLATKLMAEGRTDEEIVATLAQRRVDPAKAFQLVDDLRQGRKVTAQPSLPAEFTLRRSRSRSAGHQSPTPPSTRVPKQEREPKRPSPPAVPAGRKKPKLIWVIAGVILFLVIVVVGSILFQGYEPGGDSPAVQPPATPGTRTNRAGREGPAATARPADNAAPASLALELQADGLSIRGKVVTRDNLVPTLVSLLGPPNRTNHVSQTKTVVYAFDQHGLLIYSQPSGGTNSVVLDCEASGGTNGTTSPFAGTLRVEDRDIGPDTDSKALAAIKQLNLAAPKADGTIWNGRYKNVDLVFAYLRSPRRPSLIELDLK